MNFQSYFIQLWFFLIPNLQRHDYFGHFRFFFFCGEKLTMFVFGRDLFCFHFFILILFTILVDFPYTHTYKFRLMKSLPNTICTICFIHTHDRISTCTWYKITAHTPSTFTNIHSVIVVRALMHVRAAQFIHSRHVKTQLFSKAINIHFHLMKKNSSQKRRWLNPKPKRSRMRHAHKICVLNELLISHLNTFTKR